MSCPEGVTSPACHPPGESQLLPRALGFWHQDVHLCSFLGTEEVPEERERHLLPPLTSVSFLSLCHPVPTLLLELWAPPHTPWIPPQGPHL